ncbi:lytic murein transglycosylase [Nocardia terpenica]|uniref:Lytic transglycosylase n=1 Tax=Nocardia terpenica TaxID=455432 RepID=A0A164KIH2_9NOCA|nr:lytic murein transglycosylase [Nocardia terpenica]KZM71426.1 lytic transglycosylase [Nocardia terpenica]MBF6060872.1 lytic murein transglycosylase [Nocardia terpenica]MBF6104132.1 lytic murein transglycosylase [Nocardia terpenica]MBF6111494.1 lytic murein transglycosylase [Nocardia terpenica]MBF6118353.1 lytic murein transglycosylase [Nocardia terpenica]
MGRHRKQPATTVRRGSVIALTGLVPAGLVAVTAASASEVDTAEHAAISPDLASEQHAAPAQAVAAPAPEEMLRAAKHPGPPIVKSVAQPAGREIADVAPGPLGMPGVAYEAYQNAERVLAQEMPTCHMPWSVLAGIGQVESHHAYGKLDAKGNPIDPIYGPVLDGSLYGNNVVRETDGGELDGGMQTYARAVGPMQFLPETYRKYAGDGKGDGISDPQNIFDAALTAGKYLCDGGLDMNDLSQQSRAIMRYNNSMAYVANVMAWEVAYRTGVAPHSSQLPRI